MAAAHEHSAGLEAQLASAQDQLLALERSKGILDTATSEHLSEITRLQRLVEEARVRDGLVGELREQVDSLEQRLTRLQSKVCAGIPPAFVCCVCLCLSVFMRSHNSILICLPSFWEHGELNSVVDIFQEAFL